MSRKCLFLGNIWNFCLRYQTFYFEHYSFLISRYEIAMNNSIYRFNTIQKNGIIPKKKT